MSPTQRTLKQLRADGWLPWIVEKWNPHARRRQDLYGGIDVLALRKTSTLAIQCCAGGDVAKRVQKLKELPTLPWMLEAGWRVEVWGWRKLVTGWAPKVVVL